jgi:AraC family transcriptional regulator
MHAKPNRQFKGRFAASDIEHPQSSLIKSHLLNLSGSGLKLNGVIIERNIEQPNVFIDSTNEYASKYIVVLHSSNPSMLTWKGDGKLNESLFTKGDAIINPSGLFVAPRWSTDVEVLLLAIDSYHVNKIAEQMELSGKVELIPKFRFRDELLQQLLYNLISEFENELPPNQMDLVFVESISHSLIAHLIRRYSVEQINSQQISPKLSPRKLSRVLDYINDNLDKSLSLESIAEVAGISPSYFLNQFRESTGKSPHKYIINQRIEKAKNLLIQTNKPIAQIACETGFADQSHLTRVIRSYMGMTPKTIRTGL